MDKKLEKMLSDISAEYFISEPKRVAELVSFVKKSRINYDVAEERAASYIDNIRKTLNGVGIEAFFQQYGIETEEGFAIMSLAESLLRIPDADTANELLHDKLKNTQWNAHKKSGSTMMKASALGLKIAGKMFNMGEMVTSIADPVVRESIKKSMRMLGNNFVIGETIKEAFKKAREYEEQGYTLSYDMLGEGARSEKQAEYYLDEYIKSIEAMRDATNPSKSLYDNPAISIKLSALHPRYEMTNIEDVKARLLPRLKEIVSHAMAVGIAVTIDAEESARLDLYLEIFTDLVTDDSFKSYDGMGIAVQAYHRNSVNVIDYIISLAEHTKKRIAVRLVKGAYWDSEIKKSQMKGLPEYPVFTRKGHTDIAYLACAYKLLQNNELIYPQFATHNALTIAEIELAAGMKSFEFQCLFGMGKGVYDQIVPEKKCRIYAPVGRHKELLPYLIRRLLENSANTSFVKKISDMKLPVEDILADPLESKIEESQIPSPLDIYGKKRQNSMGFDFGNKAQIDEATNALAGFSKKTWQSAAIIYGRESIKGTVKDVCSPYNTNIKVGKTIEPSASEIKEALDVTSNGQEKWGRLDVEERAGILDNMAYLLEKNKFEAMSLCIREAGKTIDDAVAEVREAIDYCRYYAAEARRIFAANSLTSPTGESNQLSLHGRGMFVCISPWNFPLAIFLGQVAAALAAGNSVIAKPSEQTTLIAAFAVKLLLKAGVHADAIALLPGSGENVGKYVLNDQRISGVAFTGSMETAKVINRSIAQRGGEIVPFIAETGGQNAMIVDSSALIEQTVDDIVLSAFGSAGQRCSALRVLYVQEDIADNLIAVLGGAMAELKIGNPENFGTDIGPVIDYKSRDSLKLHMKNMRVNHRFVAQANSEKKDVENGYFIEPHAFEIKSINDLSGEVFGPVLHIIRFKYKDIDKVIAEINDYGYGLTFGIQSRILSRVEYIRSKIKAGNVYVNRTMIGATVGVQPFGGERLSGTGPKAGGPNYLLRFVVERVYTVNTAAIGGNRELLS